MNTQKETSEENKFSKGESEEDVSKWGAEAEALLAEADECTRRIAKHLKDMIVAAQDADALQGHAKAMELEKTLMEQKMNQEKTETEGETRTRTPTKNQLVKGTGEHERT